jgi:hypothetical protein
VLAVQKLAEIIKRLEANGRKVTDTSDQVKSIGFIGGVSRQRGNQPSPEQAAENGQRRAIRNECNPTGPEKELDI